MVPGFSLGLCLSVTFLIVDPWQYCVCFIRSGVTRCTLLKVLYLTVCASAGYTRCSRGTSVHLCTVSLQNLAVQQDLGSLSVSLWNDLANSARLAGFKSRANASLLASAALSLLYSSTVFPFLFFLSIGWYCGAVDSGLIGSEDRDHSLSALHCRHFLIIIIIFNRSPGNL